MSGISPYVTPPPRGTTTPTARQAFMHATTPTSYIPIDPVWLCPAPVPRSCWEPPVSPLSVTHTPHPLAKIHFVETYLFIPCSPVRAGATSIMLGATSITPVCHIRHTPFQRDNLPTRTCLSLVPLLSARATIIMLGATSINPVAHTQSRP